MYRVYIEISPVLGQRVIPTRRQAFCKQVLPTPMCAAACSMVKWNSACAKRSASGERLGRWRGRRRSIAPKFHLRGEWGGGGVAHLELLVSNVRESPGGSTLARCCLGSARPEGKGEGEWEGGFVVYIRRKPELASRVARTRVRGGAMHRVYSVANLLWGTEEEEVGYVYCSYIYAEVCGNGRAIYIWIVYTR